MINNPSHIPLENELIKQGNSTGEESVDLMFDFSETLEL
jgi:hypothetical protein